jgi:hypothetical protein
VFLDIDKEGIIAEIYIPKKTLQYTEEWTYENWYKYKRKFFLQDDFRKRGVRSPD